MTAYAVIGAGFGDEGKGLITDHLVRHLKSKVVARFNGGGQASHTVQTADGHCHVFSHVSAGTFAGASTFLGERFIVNPYILDAEMAELKHKGFVPALYCHENAPVTTIFDMALNAAAELARGDGRHGSCGIGINETVTRHLAGFQLTAATARYMSRSHAQRCLRAIREEWVPQRLKDLGLQESDLPTEFHLKTGEVLRNDNYEEHAIRFLMGMLHLNVGDEVSEKGDPNDAPLVLEGAQGLMLDEHLGKFPHVTRSLTGLPYAMETASYAWHKQVTPVYVTRAYRTRHGAGPLRDEGELITLDGTVRDATNVPNEWQGRIRFAPLDLSELKRFIDLDLRRAHRLHREGSDIQLGQPSIALTCLDQLGPHVRVYGVNGDCLTVDSRDLPALVAKQVGLPVSMVSRGPTSQDVEHLTEIGV